MYECTVSYNKSDKVNSSCTVAGNRHYSSQIYCITFQNLVGKFVVYFCKHAY